MTEDFKDADVEALAEVLLAVDVTPSERAGMPLPARCYLIEAYCGDLVDVVLASEWLAARDTSVSDDARRSVLREVADDVARCVEAGWTAGQVATALSNRANAAARVVRGESLA